MEDLPLHASFVTEDPGKASLVAGEVHVWAVPLHGDPSPFAALLSEAERQRVQRFRFADHQRRYQIGHGALRTVLGGYLGCDPRAIEFRQGPRGKPYLAGEGPHFNLSHSGKLALIALCEHELGIDLEKVRRLESMMQIAERHFSSGEFEALGELDDDRRELGFYRCWTRKEAYIKALGEGLSMALDTFDVSLCEDPRFLACHDGREDPARWSLVDVSPGPEFVAAVAMRASRPAARTFRLAI
ncbi:MAG: 4'-phosphopantetheinyl transferase superfamily protein [Planctomycetes bacterium]|nr:4'-phosphopantetheinyl transferase superfamily protein [Planctomycetota bacterium]